MSRAERRRQQKLAKKVAKREKHVQSTTSSSMQQSPALKEQLERAMGHHASGRLPEAESLYQQVLHVEPRQPVALHLLGLIAHQVGKNDIAVDHIKKALAINPGYAEAHCNLGMIYQQLGHWDQALASCHKALAINPNFAEAYNNLGNALKELMRLDEAVKNYDMAIAINPGYADAHSNLGNALKELGRREEALASCHKALTINPDFAEAYNNLGNILKELGRLDEAVVNYNKALAINPDYAEALNNLGIAMKDLGQVDKAVQVLQSAFEKDPENRPIAETLIDLLDHHMPEAASRGAHAKAQQELQQQTIRSADTALIGDAAAQHLFQQGYRILAAHNLGDAVHPSQIFRGVNIDQGCTRHMVVFDKFNAIPEYCFGCYKVYVEPRDVVDLIKLMMVFDSIELPADNTRKCMVEMRPEIAGAYKGYIYCKGLDEGKEILKIVKQVVGQRISNQTPVSLKRGCSEYLTPYPEFGLIEDNNADLMTYNEEWRQHEDHVDNVLIEHTYPPVFDTFNHSGLTLRDGLAMRTWLEYAAAIGDLSYLNISGSPVRKLALEKRAPFQQV